MNTRPTSFAARTILAASIAALLTQAADADLIWNSTGLTDNWSTAAGNPNWLPGNIVWIQNENAIFNATSGTPEPISVTTAIVFDNMTFDVTGFSISSTGGGSFQLANDLASTITVTNASDAAFIGQTFANNAGGPSTLTKAGLGTLTFNGTAASTYSGGTIISAGTLAITQAGALGTGPVTNSATLNINVGNTTPTGLANSLSGAGIVNVTLPLGTNTTILNGNYSGFTGTWNVGISAVAGSGKVQMNGVDNAAATINILTHATLFSTGTVTHNATIILNGGDTGESLGQLRLDSGSIWAGPVTLAGDMTGAGDGIVGSNAGVGTISGAIGETGGSRVLSKSGPGTIALTGPNTYTGKTVILNGALSASSLNKVSGGTASSNLGAPTTVDNGTIDIGSGTAAVQLIYTGTGETTDRVINLSGTTGGVTLTQSGASGNLKFTSDFTATGSGNKTLTLQGSTAGTGEIAGAIVNSAGLNTGLTKTGNGTWTLSGSNTYTGTTTVNQGTLRLDYSTNDNSKLADTNGPLVFGGGTVELSGGSHTEFVTSTTLTAGASSIVSRSSGGAVLQLNNITPNATTSLTFTGFAIATTNNLNTNGILGFWARTNISGVSSWATNAADAANGSIIPYTDYTNVARFLDGAPTGTIPSGATNNIRIVNSGTAGNIALGGGALTQAYTIQNDSSGATIAPAAATDVLNVGNDAGGAIWQTSNAGSLTIGATANDGVLTTGATANSAPALLRVINDSASNVLTINSAITNNGTDVVSVTKSGAGTVLVAGNNTFTGALTAGPGGTVILSGNNIARPAGTSGLTTVNAGGVLQLQANAGNTTAGVSTALSTETTANQPLIVSAGGTLQLRGDSPVTFTGANNFGGLGSATITIDVNQLTAAGIGNKLSMAPGGFNVNTTTINVTGGNGYVLGTGTITNVTGTAGAVMTLNPTTAAVSIAGYTGTTAFTSTLALSGASAGNAVTGPITNTTSATPAVISVTKNGSSAWELSGVNTYTGATTVNQGILTLSGARTAAATGGFNVGGVAGSTGTLNVTNGAFTVGAAGSNFLIGSAAGGTGLMNQSGGSLTTIGNQLLIGNFGGTGIYNLSGGTLTTIAGSLGVTVGVNTGSTATFNLSDTGTLTMPATSTLQITRSDNSAASGVTGTFAQTGGTATVGILQMGGSSTTPANNAGANATLNLAGGTFSAVTFNQLSGGTASTSAINIGGTAAVTLPAFPTARGPGATATITFDGGALTPAAASATYMGGLTNAFIKSGGATFNVPTGRDITVTQFLEDFTGHAGPLTKSGAGTLTLTNGGNSFTGTTTISGGALSVPFIGNIGAASPLGAGNSTSPATNTASLVFNGGTLNFTGGFGFTDRGFTLNGAGTINLPTGNNNALTFTGNVTGPGALTLNGASTVGLQNVLTLSGSNAGFTGNVTANIGGIRITNSTALGTGTKSVTLTNGTAGNANLQLDGSAGDILLPSTFTYTVSNQTSNGTIVNIAGNNTVAGQINNTTGGGAFMASSLGGHLTISANITATAAGRAVILAGPSNGTVSGIISDGATVGLPVTKSGAGSWTFSNTNTYTGATNVNEGTLYFAANQTLTSLVIANGATAVIGAPPPPAPELAAVPAPDFGSAAFFDGELSASGTAAVPEPGSAALLIGGMFTLLGLRRRK